MQTKTLIIRNHVNDKFKQSNSVSEINHLHAKVLDSVHNVQDQRRGSGIAAFEYP